MNDDAGGTPYSRQVGVYRGSYVLLYYSLVTLYYTIQGSGEPIVLLHGFLSSSDYWKSLIPLLARRHTVITIDLLGFGKSPKPRRSTYSREAHATAVIETISSLIGTYPFTLVGHSMGSLIAAEISLRIPDRIHHLTLFNMPVLTDPIQARRVYAGTSPLYRTMLYSPLAPIGWMLLKYLLAPPHRTLLPRRAKTVAPLLRHSKQSRSRSLRNTIESTDGIGLLRYLKTDTTYVGGLRDRQVYIDMLSLYARKLPQTLDVVWLDADHHIPTQLPETAAALISQRVS